MQPTRRRVLKAGLAATAVGLGRADMADAGARAAGDLFEDFEAMGGEYGAHEMLEAADEEACGTFETAGTHEYVCLPHESAGMEGRILVE